MKQLKPFLSPVREESTGTLREETKDRRGLLRADCVPTAPSGEHQPTSASRAQGAGNQVQGGAAKRGIFPYYPQRSLSGTVADGRRTASRVSLKCLSLPALTSHPTFLQPRRRARTARVQPAEKLQSVAPCRRAALLCEFARLAGSEETWPKGEVAEGKEASLPPPREAALSPL